MLLCNSGEILFLQKYNIALTNSQYCGPKECLFRGSKLPRLVDVDCDEYMQCVIFLLIQKITIEVGVWDSGLDSCTTSEYLI